MILVVISEARFGIRPASRPSNSAYGSTAFWRAKDKTHVTTVQRNVTPANQMAFGATYFQRTGWGGKPKAVGAARSIVGRQRAVVDPEKLYGIHLKGHTYTQQALGAGGRKEMRNEMNLRRIENKAYGTVSNMPTAVLQARIDRNVARQQAWAQRGIVRRNLAQRKADAAAAGGTQVQVSAHTRKNPKTGEPVQVGAYVRTARQKEIENIFANGTMVGQKPLEGGHTEVYQTKVELNGQKVDAVWKPASGEDDGWIGVPKGTGYKREIAGYRVAAVLGLSEYLPVTVQQYGKSERGGEHDTGALMEFVNSGLKNMGDSLAAMLGNTDAVFKGYDKKLLGKLAAYDYIIGNLDGHLANIKASDDKKRIKLYDHGRSLSSTNQENIRSVIGVYVRDSGIKIKDSIGSEWDGKWPEIYNTLTTVGIEPKAISAAQVRFDDLIKTKNAGMGFGGFKANSFYFHGDDAHHPHGAYTGQSLPGQSTFVRQIKQRYG